jgi:arylsulfatase A-like enzyme
MSDARRHRRSELNRAFALQATAELRSAGWILTAALLLVSIACQPVSTDLPAKRDIYVLLVDTLRADHLSLYGYERPTSPNLDRFAASATVFENVMATSSWTLPSVSSLMTGLYPAAHGVNMKAVTELNVLRPGVRTLAEVLASEGYRTVAIVTNPYLVRNKHGISRGFEEYHTAWMKNASQVNDLARKIITSNDDPRPLFLYIHYMDPHGPYDRHPETDPTPLGPIPARLDRPLTRKQLNRIPDHLRLPDRDDLGSYIQAYDRSILAWDESFGDWIAWLDARSTRPDPIVAILADHGEEFTERGAWDHGRTLHREVLAVPWVLRVPGRSASRVSNRVVSLIDVAPTLLGALELPTPTQMRGLDVSEKEFEPGRPVFAMTVEYGADPTDHSMFMRAVRRDDLKFIQKGSQSDCYELARDPGERRSICEKANWRDRAESDIKNWNRENEDIAAALGAGEKQELGLEQQERLRAIGYIE